MAWFVQLNGKIFGPLNDSQMVQLASAGKICPDTEVSQLREGPWVPATRIKGLFDPGSGKSADASNAGHEGPSATPAAERQNMPHTAPHAEGPIPTPPGNVVPPRLPPSEGNPRAVDTHGIPSDGSASATHLAALLQADFQKQAVRQWVALGVVAGLVLFAAVHLGSLGSGVRDDCQQLRNAIVSPTNGMKDKLDAVQEEFHSWGDEILFPEWEYRVESPSDTVLIQSLDEYGKQGWEVIEARRASDSLRNFSYEVLMKRRKRR